MRDEEIKVVLTFPKVARVIDQWELFCWLDDNYRRGYDFYMNDQEQIVGIVKVDDEDWDELCEYTWYLKIDNITDPNKRHVSVGRNALPGESEYKPTSLVLMSRHILKLHIKGIVVNYQNGNVFDHRKDNLLIPNTTVTKLVKLREYWLQNAMIEAGLPA